MRVLVTGAAGRIGRRTIHAFLDLGHDVRGFDLRAAGIDRENYEDCIGSLENKADVANAVDGVDVILHLGAVMSWAPQDRALMHRVNVEGTRLLLEESKAARFVFASSGEVYPENAPQAEPITEDHPLCPNSPYGLTKLLGETIVQFHQRAGAETVILRFSHTQDAAELLDESSFFSGPRFFLRPRILQQERLGNSAVAEILRAHDPGQPSLILARNEDGRPFRMHITESGDMVTGLVLAATHPRAAGGTYNLGATVPIDFAPLLEEMREITGYPVVAVDFPGPGVYYHTSNERIRTELGYDPEWTIERMLAVAAQARNARRAE